MNFEKPTNSGYTIYSKDNCSYCVNAKKLLKDDEIHIIPCDEYIENNKHEFLSFISKTTGKDHRTFPIIFHNNSFVGGYTELEKYYFDINDLF